MYKQYMSCHFVMFCDTSTVSTYSCCLPRHVYVDLYHTHQLSTTSFFWLFFFGLLLQVGINCWCALCTQAHYTISCSASKDIIYLVQEGTMPWRNTKTNFQSPPPAPQPNHPLVHVDVSLCALCRYSAIKISVQCRLRYHQCHGWRRWRKCHRCTGLTNAETLKWSIYFCVLHFCGQIRFQPTAERFVLVCSSLRPRRSNANTNWSLWPPVSKIQRHPNNQNKTRVRKKQVDIVQLAKPQQNPNHTPLTWSCKFENSAICALVLMACKSFLLIAVGPRTVMQEINNKTSTQPLQNTTILQHKKEGIYQCTDQ